MSLNDLAINNVSPEETKPREGQWGEVICVYEGATHTHATSVNTEEQPGEHHSCNIFVCSFAHAA